MDAPRRPWWRRKRWVASGLLCFAVAYPLSAGPARYCAAREWVPWEVVVVAYLPARLACEALPDAARDRVLGHLLRWEMAGHRAHREAILSRTRR